MTTWIDTDPEGFPPGTYIVNHPPTCTAPDAYVKPVCSQWTQEIHFPDIWALPPTGSVSLLEIAVVASTAVVLAALVLLVVKIKDHPSDAPRDR
ncbi:hypothetical protein [Microbacterium lacus]|uniref:hypothetical protein n=1 Tax=Microbacterium lacus TaxID=415217 RepID=UPI000C2BD393|nr:hypothetical protein [Microbacterium lacus]